MGKIVKLSIRISAESEDDAIILLSMIRRHIKSALKADPGCESVSFETNNNSYQVKIKHDE